MSELGKLLTSPESVVDLKPAHYVTGTVLAWTAGTSNNIDVSGGPTRAGPNLNDVPYLSSIGTINPGDKVAMLAVAGQYIILGKITRP